MEKEETTNGNGMTMPNSMWGNMNWGNTPYWNYPQKQGASGMDVAALVLGIAGTAFGLMSGGLGLFNNNRNGYGPNGQGGPNVMERLSAVEAAVAVNTQRDIDLQEQTKLQIENAKQAAEIDILKSKAETTALVTMVNNQVITNGQRLTCLENDLGKILQIGIPQANIIPTPTSTATTAG